MELKSENIFLSVIKESDLSLIYEWKNDIKLSTLINSYFYPISYAEVEEWFKKNQNDKNQVLFGIYLVKTVKLIGVVRLMFIDWIGRNSEFGIYIGDFQERGKGYGKEIIDMILKYAFCHLNLKKVYLKVAESMKRWDSLKKVISESTFG
jgi:RimJ/RimL family protein N-acetyltransferase